MLTVVETLLFQKQWPLYWTEEERGEFAAYIAEFPDAGAVVPEFGGIRKVRWRRAVRESLVVFGSSISRERPRKRLCF
jgi:hypothetical protein